MRKGAPEEYKSTENISLKWAPKTCEILDQMYRKSERKYIEIRHSK